MPDIEYPRKKSIRAKYFKLHADFNRLRLFARLRCLLITITLNGLLMPSTPVTIYSKKLTGRS